MRINLKKDLRTAAPPSGTYRQHECMISLCEIIINELGVNSVYVDSSLVTTEFFGRFIASNHHLHPWTISKLNEEDYTHQLNNEYKSDWSLISSVGSVANYQRLIRLVQIQLAPRNFSAWAELFRRARLGEYMQMHMQMHISTSHVTVNLYFSSIKSFQFLSSLYKL